MNLLANANLADAADHDVLAEPCTYDVVAYSYVAEEPPFGTLELTLKSEEETVQLRFTGVHELTIDPGFPHSCMGLEILDVRYLGWEYARVRVQGFENSPGIRFWAREVSRIGP
jgi:hypothetical protein